MEVRGPVSRTAAPRIRADALQTLRLDEVMTANSLGLTVGRGVPTACPVVAAAAKKVQGNEKIFASPVRKRQFGRRWWRRLPQTLPGRDNVTAPRWRPRRKRGGTGYFCKLMNH